MTSTSSGPGKKARIEIIPLIDIMFFLLASFMLVSLSMVRLQAVKTNVPAATTGVNVPKPDFIPIGIDKNGNVYFDKEKDPVPAEQVPLKLQPMFAKSGDELKVFINADSDATYEMVINVLDKLRNLGIKKVSFPVKASTQADPGKPRATTNLSPVGQAPSP